jgi:hypothetical protein
MVMLAVVQLVGLGHALGGDGHYIDVDHGDLDVEGGLLSLIGFGRLPLLMWLMLLLALFGLIGLTGQEVLAALFGQSLSGWIATPMTALVALPATGLLARPLAAILPRDETTAVSIDTLVGREAELVIGRATPGNPARARVLDVHGLAHHVMVEPDGDGQTFVQGERVLLVRREGDLFKAITRGDHHLPRLD